MFILHIPLLSSRPPEYPGDPLIGESQGSSLKPLANPDAVFAPSISIEALEELIRRLELREGDTFTPSEYDCGCITGF